MGRHVLLIGMMGSGKTTVGRIVAQRLRRPFSDSDVAVEERTSMTVPEIFASRGERAFRAEELAVLSSALSGGVPCVIAVAGGAVLDPESRRRLRSAGVVAWLDVPPHVLAERLGAGVGRPLLGEQPAAVLAQLDAVRRPVYSALADFRVVVDRRPPMAVAEELVRLARGRLDGTGP